MFPFPLVSSGCLLPVRRCDQSNRWGRWEAVLCSDPRICAGPVLWKECCTHLVNPNTGEPEEPVWSWNVHCWWATGDSNFKIFKTFMWQVENNLICIRSRGGSAQKDGVPGVCVSRPLWIFQVSELSVPNHPHPTRKRLHLDPHRTDAGPHCQGVCQWQQLAQLCYGLVCCFLNGHICTFM